MDQQRTFPRIYSPHLIDYFRTWGFKAGQEFLTWRPEPGVPGYTVLPEDDTLVGELFCLRLRVSPGEQQKDPITKGWSLRGLSVTLDLQETILIQLHFFWFIPCKGPFLLKISEVFVWNLPAVFSSLLQHWVRWTCTFQVQSKSLYLKTSADPLGGFGWLKSRLAAWESCQRHSQSALLRRERLSESHFSRGLNYSHDIARLWTMNASEAYFWITVVMTSPRSQLT